MEGAPLFINGFNGPFTVWKYISKLTYTDDTPPLFVEKFWEVMYMIRYCKDNMKVNSDPLLG